jgi:hypothetical protein
MTDIQEQILNIRKELRDDYLKFCQKYHKLMTEIDSYFESLSKGLEKREGGN